MDKHSPDCRCLTCFERLENSVKKLAKQNLALEARWLMTRDALESAEAEIAKMREDNEKQAGEWTRIYRDRLEQIAILKLTAYHPATHPTPSKKDKIVNRRKK